jgi:ribonuclease P protein component
MPGHRFPKALRLLSRREFDAVFTARSSASDAWMVVYGAENELGHARLGLAVSRRFGGSVARNRWKRRLREAFRLEQHALPALDLVCVPRATALPTVAQLSESLALLANRVERQLAKRRLGNSLPSCSQAKQMPHDGLA